MTALAARTLPAATAAPLVVASQRLMLLMLLFVAATAMVGARLAWLAIVGDTRATATVSASPRADIVDRNGQVLARTIDAWSIGVHPDRLLNPPRALARQLAELLPERSEREYHALLTSGARFTYLRRRALPDLVARVNALGEPAMAFAREPERMYPQGSLAAHVLGFTDFDGAGVSGMERALDARLTDAAQSGPVALALDMRVQAAMESELAAAMARHSAIGATGLVLDVDTGELLSMVSLPVFNPNRAGAGHEDTRRNNVTQSVYELGSTFKPITIANAIEARVVTSMTKRYDATRPLAVGRFRINDDHPAHRALNVPETLVQSSNIVTARIADEMGAERMAAGFRKLHFDTAPDIELKERGRPIWPSDWGRSTVMTTGYGHGIAVTPLHLATAYAALVNGGIWRPATLLKVAPGKAPRGSRVYSAATSMRMRQLLRLIVMEGTGRKANADGLRVGGKTGTAEKPSAGGYAKRSLVSSFAAAFPMDAPRYVVIAMLDEPKGTAETFGFATAGWVAAPVASKVIARIGPLLGVIPDADRDIDESELLPLLWKPKGAR